MDLYHSVASEFPPQLVLSLLSVPLVSAIAAVSCESIAFSSKPNRNQLLLFLPKQQLRSRAKLVQHYYCPLNLMYFLARSLHFSPRLTHFLLANSAVLVCWPLVALDWKILILLLYQQELFSSCSWSNTLTTVSITSKAFSIKDHATYALCKHNFVEAHCLFFYPP